MSISRTEIAVDSDHATLRRSRAAFDYVDAPIIATDASGYIVAVNRCALDLIGYTRAELLSQSIDMLLPSNTVSAAHNAWHCALDGEDIAFACGMRCKRGSLIPVSMYLHGVIHERYAEGVVATLHETPGSDAVTVSMHSSAAGAPNAASYSEQLLEHLLRTLPGFVSIVRLQDERIMRVNEYFLRYLGLQLSEVIGKTSADLGWWQDAKQREQVWQRFRTEGRVENVEMQFVHPRTGARDVLLTQELIQLDGEPQVLIIGVDITEQKITERNLQHTAEQFKRHYQNLPLPTYSWRKIGGEFILIAYNDTAAAATNNRISEYIGCRASEMYRERPIVIEHLQLCFDSKNTTRHEGWFRLMSTRQEHYIIASYVYIAPDIVMVHVDDRTAAKQAEIALRDSEARARQMVEANPVGISFSNASGQLFEANHALLNIVGYTRDDLLAGCINELALTAPKYIKVTQRVLAALAKGEKPAQYRSEYVRKDGKSTPVLVGKSNIGTGMVVGFVVDLTETTRAEQQIELREKLLDAVHQAVIAVDLNGVITYWNRFAEVLYRRAVSDAVGHHLANKVCVREADKISELLQSALQGDVRTEEFDCHRSDDNVFFGWLTSTPLYAQEGEISGAIVVCIDISERKKLEDDAIKAQKLESIGVLAGGIAHDFNNVLTAILGNISLAKLHANAPERVAEALAQAETGFWRARELTNQLLTFARGGAPVRKVGLLNKVLTDTCQFALSGAVIGLQLKIATDLWPANFDPGQISQVVNNLVNNSKEAMPHGGTLSVEADNIDLPNGVAPLPPGRYVRLTFADTGTGIPSDHLARVFDPYFSTKNRGSGLGLAMVYSIVHRHGGHIAIESQVDVGTRISIFLPAVNAEASMTKAEDRSTHTSQNKIAVANILVMDDDPMIRDVASKLLRGLGYLAEVAVDGKQAIELYKKAQAEGRPFAAVILDLTVPGAMGGLECLNALRALDKSIRAIVSSGYSNDPIVANYREHGFTAVVNKPYRLSDLQTTLADVLAHSL